MNINFKNVLYIIFASSLIGLAFNFFSSSKIPLIREDKKIVWADDSLLNIQSESALDSVIADESGLSEKDYPVTKEIKKPADKNLEQKKEEKKQEEKTIIEFDEPKTITADQAYKLYNQNVVFIDARERNDFAAGHIRGAINIPYYSFEEFKFLLKNIAKDKPVVTYCGGTDCDLSIILGNQLFKLGYKQVYIFFGGWNQWKENNYPVEE